MISKGAEHGRQAIKEQFYEVPESYIKKHKNCIQKEAIQFILEDIAIDDSIPDGNHYAVLSKRLQELVLKD